MRFSIFSGVTLLGVVMALAGCGEMVFKRGADPGAMAVAQTDCRAAGDGEAAYVACMEGKGFLVKGSQDSVFAEGLRPTPGGAAATPTSVAPVAAVPGGGTATGTAGVVSPARAQAPQAVDPLERVKVASWWKLGGTPDQLAAAQAQCGETLGVAHRPATDGNEVTRAMVDCLRAAGWRGLGR